MDGKNSISDTARKIVVVLLFIPFWALSAKGIEQSYDRYHNWIRTAEEYYFLQNNTDSALFYYQKCFETFDFVFARDAVNAFQIAYKENRPLEYFLKIAIQSGVTPTILESIPALSNFAQDSLRKLGVMKDYDLYRSRYLDRINVACLINTYRLGIIDQLKKGNGGRYRNYNATESLFKLASEFGIPGEKNCGIESLTIQKELESEAADFLKIRDRMAEEDGKDLGYYRLNENTLIMHIPIVVMLHDYCIYKYYEKALHQAYLEGNIHPREIGSIYDNSYRGGSECKILPLKGIFGLNLFYQSGKLDSTKADQLRAKWEICSIETDLKKEEQEKLGYKFIWDYW